MRIDTGWAPPWAPRCPSLPAFPKIQESGHTKENSGTNRRSKTNHSAAQTRLTQGAVTNIDHKLQKYNELPRARARGAAILVGAAQRCTAELAQGARLFLYALTQDAPLQAAAESLPHRACCHV